MRKEDYFKAKYSNADQERNIDDLDGGYYSRLFDAAEARAATSGSHAYEPDFEDNVSDEQITAWANEGQEF